MAVLWVGATVLVYLLELNWQRFDQIITANEERALQEVRILSAAEQAYALSHHGYYDLPSRLGDPRAEAAVPGEGQRSGYLRRFHPGPPPDREAIGQAGLSPSSLRSFAYLARPVDPGTSR